MLLAAEASATGAETQILEVYGELREIASRLLRHEREGHTLQKTALVHEAFIRLFERNPDAALSARNFLGLAAHQMRRILVDYARRRHAAKREGGLLRVPLFEAELGFSTDQDLLLALEQAMDGLAKLDARAHSVVELKYFAGFTNRETADILGISDGTVEQDWQFARAWLFGILSVGPRVTENRLRA